MNTQDVVMPSAGACFRAAIQSHQPLPIVGAINAYSALLAEQAGHAAIYCSGAGVANASYGWPDLGQTTLEQVLVDVKRLLSATSLPLLVDIDTGWEQQPGGVAHTIIAMEAAGVAAVHLEDQVAAKRCGHRPDKQLVTTETMVERIQTAVSAKTDPDFVIMARTDALAGEGMTSAIERAIAYCEAGADMIFFEAAKSLSDYETFCASVSVPVLANSTEFGQAPLFSRKELFSAGVAMVLYPLSAFRAMSQAAETVYRTLLSEDNQSTLINTMQTRDELYAYLNYWQQESEQRQGTQEEKDDE